MYSIRVFVLGFLAAAWLHSQDFRGTVLGRITDSSGAVVSGARVTLTNAETSVILRAASNDSGDYQIPFVVPGDYRMAIEHPGFRTVERPAVQVNTQARVTVNAVLEIGATTDSVTVSAENSLLNTVNADSQQVVSKQFVDKIILSKNRDVINIVAESTGIAGAFIGARVTDGGNTTMAISGGGGKTGNNQLFIDGMPDTTAGASQFAYIPSLDTVKEVQVQTSLFDAQYGMTQGGAISITTLGGGNDLHGTAYLFKRWTPMEANSWANNRAGAARPAVKFYQAGYNITGPVYIPKIYRGRNKTFFTHTLETNTEYEINSPQGRVPTALERQGNFSQTLNSAGSQLIVYDPASTIVNGTTVTRQPFPNNTIPAARITPTGSAILNLYPLPNLAVAPQINVVNWAASGNNIIKQSSVNARVDHNMNDNNRLFGTFGRLKREVDGNIQQTPGSLGNYPNNSNSVNYRWFEQGGIDDTFNLSPTFVGSVRAGVVRYSDGNYGGYVGYDPAKLQLPAVITQNQFVGGWPNFTLNEGMIALSNSYSASGNTSIFLVSSFTKISGKHSIKFGTDLRRNQNNSINPGTGAEGAFTYSAAFTTANPNVASSTTTSGTSMASALLGLPISGSLGYNSPTSLSNYDFAAYVQDDWKITRNLTLNFGIRWDVETEWRERYNRVLSGFDFNASLPVQVPGFNLKGGALFAGVGGNSSSIAPAYWKAFGPRVGFAYQPLPNTVVRGGFGIFYSPLVSNQGFTGTVGSFNSSTPFVGSTDNGVTPYATLANPFPNGLLTPPGASAGLMAQVGNSLTILNPNIRLPYTEQWQISVQHEFPSRLLVEASYLGSLSLRQLESFNLNEIPDYYLQFGSQATTKVSNPFLNLFPSTSTLGQGATLNQSSLWVRYPQFTSLTINGMNTGKTSRHSLNLKADKRLTHNLSAIWTFTWAKMLTANTTSLVNPRHYRSVPSIDQPFISRMVLVYELPWKVQGTGFEKNFLRSVFTGWSISGSFDFETGFPMSITGSNGRPYVLRDPSLSGSINQRLGDRKDAKGLPLNPYFDVTAFQALPNQYTVSPTPLYLPYLRQPGTFNVNGSLFKSFQITEHARLEVRADAVGLTNTPNFGAPGTNLNSPSTFGVITTATGQRLTTVSARVSF